MARIARRSLVGIILVPFAVIALIAFSPAPGVAFAQGQGGRGTNNQGGGGGGDDMTCGWCRVVSDSFYQMDNPVDPDSWGWVQFTQHYFPDGGDECGFPGPSDGICARCGSEAALCHSDLEDPDHCHVACGGDELAKAGAEIERALASGDTKTVAKLVRTRHQKFAAEYLADGGRIDLNANCDKSAPALEYAVPLPLRPALSRLLSE